MKHRVSAIRKNLVVRSFTATSVSSSIALMLAACGSATPPVPYDSKPPVAEDSPSNPVEPVQKKSADADQDTEVQSDESYLYLTEEIEAAMIGPDAPEIESPEFQVGNFNVSLVESRQGSLPIVSFTPVENADFYQVARCDSATTTESGDSSTVEFGGLSAAEIIKLQIESKLWEAVSAHPQCEIIAESLSRSAFIDQNPSQTAVNYVIRACSFVSDQTSQSGQLCSQFVTLSNTLPKVAHQVRETVSQLKTKIGELHSDVDTASVQLAAKTREFASAVIECEKTERRANMTRHKKDLLHTLIGIGAKIGSYLLAGESLNPFQALKSIWDNRMTIIEDAGLSMLELAKDVFATERQSIKMCTQAQLKSTEAALMVGEISEKTKAIADLVKEAIASGQVRP